MAYDERYLYSSEEEEFAAAADSGEEEDGGAAKPGARTAAQDEGGEEEGGMQLGNVVITERGGSGGGGSVEAPAWAGGPPQDVGAQALKLPTFQFASKRQQRLDGRVLLLFDINGVLMQHRWNGTSHQHDLRPGIHHLLRLVPHFRLGVYSSATRPTVSKALSKLHNNLANFLEQRRRQAATAAAAAAAAGAGAGSGGKKGAAKRKAAALAQAAAAAAAAGTEAAGGAAAGASTVAMDSEGFPLELPPSLFEVVMARDHCQPASQEDIVARGGRPWDTVKPLSKYFGEGLESLGRLVLVDDSAHKAASGEGANMLVMPCWPGPAHPLGRADGSLPLLVDLLLSHAGPGAAAGAAAAAGGRKRHKAQKRQAQAQAQASGCSSAAAAPAEGTAELAGAELDVRRVTAGISKQLAAAAARHLEQAQATGLLTGEEAAAAAAVVEAAVSGSAAVAAAAAEMEASGAAEHAAAEMEDEQQSRREQQQAGVSEGLAATAAADAGAAPLSKRQRRELARAQVAAQGAAQQAAARVMLLAAAEQLERGAFGAFAVRSGSGGVSIAEINAYLNHAWLQLSNLAFFKTSKAAVLAAVDDGLLEGVPAAPAADDAAAAAENAAAAAAVSEQAQQGWVKRAAYRLTAAGEAGVPSQQYMSELASYCRKFGSQQELVAAIQSQQQPQQQPQQQQQQQQSAASAGGIGSPSRKRGREVEEQQPQAQQQQEAAPAPVVVPAAVGGGELPGFFWEAQQQTRPQTQQQTQPPPAPAEAPAATAAAAAASALSDLPSLQRSVLLFAVAQLRGRRGFTLESVEHWVHAQLLPRFPGLPVQGQTAKADKAPSQLKAGKAVSRALRQMLLAALGVCEQKGLLTASKFGPNTPPTLLLCSRTPAGAAAGAPGKAEVEAALGTLAGVLASCPAVLAAEAAAAGRAAAGRHDAAGAQAAPAAGGTAADAAVAVAKAAPAAATPAASGAEAEGPGSAAVDADMADADMAAAGGAGEAAPLLLAVFEDKAPAPMAAAAPAAPAVPAATTAVPQPARGIAAAEVVRQLAAGIAAAAAQHLSKKQQRQEEKRQRRLLEEASAGLARRAAASDAKERGEEVAALRASMKGLSMKVKDRRAVQVLLSTAEATGLPLAQLQGLDIRMLKKLRKRQKKQVEHAHAQTAQAALDRLFDAAAVGSEEAWQEACSGLSAEEQEALKHQRVDLEEYRRKIAAAARLAGTATAVQDAGGCSSGSDASGGGGSDAGDSSSGEETDEGEEDEVEGGVKGKEKEEEEEGEDSGWASGLGGTSGSDWEPSSGGEESEAEEEDKEASSSSGEEEDEAAAVQAAVAAHGGHYLRSCGQPVAAAAAGAGAGVAVAAGEGAQWFWERRQQQERGVGQQQQQQQGTEQQRPQQPLSPLHFEVDSFAQRATPTPQEAEAVQAAVLAVNDAARTLWPHSRTALFGSQATGLALPGSDLDIVVLNVGATLARAGTGFTPVQRKQLSELLEDLLDTMLQRHLLKGKAQIIEARVPIIKCKLNFGGGLAADISLGAENGAQAVDFVRRQVLAVPPLRPLCLAVKAFLRERGHNEVFSGGLSSYSVFNMVMAHLQCEGYSPHVPEQPPTPAAAAAGARGGQGGGRAGRGGRGQQQQQQQGPRPSLAAELHETLSFLRQLAAGALPAMSQRAQQGQQQQQQRSRHMRFGDSVDEEEEEEEAGGEAASVGGEGPAPAMHGPPTDLGVLLWGFFDRFGSHFSYTKHAVSIRMGGVCSKLKAWRHSKKPWLLAVEDPQEMGKDIGSGSFAIRDIKERFAEAAELLAEVCEDLDANQAAEAAAAAAEAAVEAAAGAVAGAEQAGPASAAAQQQQQQQQQGGERAGSVRQQLLLAGVLDVEAAVGRSADAAKLRATMEAKAAAKSAAVLHQRIRAGVAVGHRQRSTKPRGREAKQAFKAERRAAQKAAAGGEVGGGRGPGSSAKQRRRLGSRRGAAVEAQWGSQRGQYKDHSEDEGPAWSLRQQKKPKTKGGGSGGKKGGGGGDGGSAKKGGGGASARKKGGKGAMAKKKQQQKRGQAAGGSGGGSAKKKARHG